MAEPHEKIYRSKKTIFINNLVGGIGWAIGATVGLAIIFALLSFVVSNAKIVPIVGNFIVDVNQYILQNNPQLIRQ